MLSRILVPLGVAAGAVLLMGGGAPQSAPRRGSAPIQVNVVLVQLNIAVTDKKGHYISGLRPEDFTIYEDKIPEKIAWFEEGDKFGRRIIDVAGPQGSAGASHSEAPDAAGSRPPTPGGPDDPSGANVFILFDTSNYMYRGFVFAQDAITGFVRSMTGTDKIAFYSYSRDLSRGNLLTADHTRVLNAVRTSVAGDDAALYNCLLMTVQDAATLRGRKAIVVFSNGPDNASSVPPEDVEELAQSTGTIIYIISTREAQTEPVSAAVFERMSKATGGKAYFAKNWEEEGRAFSSIQDDLAHLYTVSYYPKANANRGWRRITIKLTGEAMQKYHVRTRDGYRLLEHGEAAMPEPVSERSTVTDPPAPER